MIIRDVAAYLGGLLAQHNDLVISMHLVSKTFIFVSHFPNHLKLHRAVYELMPLFKLLRLPILAGSVIDIDVRLTLHQAAACLMTQHRGILVSRRSDFLRTAALFFLTFVHELVLVAKNLIFLGVMD